MPATAAEASRVEGNRRFVLVELVGEATVELTDELGAGQCRARLGAVQLDRGAHGVHVVGIGCERLRPAVPPQ
jgi:hypothetical protein